MKKICMINIWVGKLPDTFPLWLQSAHKNPTVDFVIITDNANLKSQGNVKFVNMSFDEIRTRFQKMFPFKIHLKTPYKMCDYKPVWGWAFEEIIEGYDFWGHFDLDIIFGDIRKFVTDDLLDNYDKLFDAGYFVLYRNSEQMRSFYKLSDRKDNMAYSYKKAFRCDYACYFDEYMGMSILGWQYCETFRDQLTEDMIQDFSWQRLNFQSYITGDSFVLHWENGKLYRHRCDEGGVLYEEEPKELLLVHIQKRRMDVAFSMEDMDAIKEYWIVPNCYTLKKPSGQLYNAEKLEEYQEFIRVQDKKRRIDNMKKFGILAYIPHRLRSRKIQKWIREVKKFY